jgi:hypothetical protein
MKFKPYQILLICAAVAVIAWVVFYRNRVQGFQTPTSPPCAERDSINFCLGLREDPYDCGWCSSSSKCVDIKVDDNGYIVPDPDTSTCSDSYQAFNDSNINTNYTYENPNVEDSEDNTSTPSRMPLYQETCENITDIDTCNSKTKCSWCGEDSKCVTVSIDGNYYTSKGECSDDTTLSNYRIPFRNNDDGEWVVGSGTSSGDKGMPWKTVSEDDISWRSKSAGTSSGSASTGGSTSTSGSGSGSTSGSTSGSGSASTGGSTSGSGSTSTSESQPAPVSDITAGSAYAQIVNTVLQQSGLFQNMMTQFQKGCE